MWSCSVVVIISRKTCIGNLSFVDLVESDDVANGVGVNMFKTEEALRAFFFSTSVELKTKGAGEEELVVKD